MMEAAIEKNISRLDDLYSALAFYSSELTGDRDHIFKLNNDLKDLRNDMGSSRSTATGDRNKSVTGLKGFEKLKVYTGAVSQWKELRYKVTTFETAN